MQHLDRITEIEVKDLVGIEHVQLRKVPRLK